MSVPKIKSPFRLGRVVDTRSVALAVGFTLLGWAMMIQNSAKAAGVTVITHGHWSSVEPWVIPMAGDIANHPEFPANSYSCYELYFTNNSASSLTYRAIGASIPPTNSLTGEILIKLEWGDYDENSTQVIGDAFFPGLTNQNFISELGGHALCELPIHLIGHSRGASLVTYLARKFGEQGIWIDQLTTLDPHPIGNDPLVVVPDNVLFADNYWQTVNAIAGHHVVGAFNRHMSDLVGGYGFFSGGDHANVHLWYHGTINQSIPLIVDGITLTASMSTNWYVPEERGNSGFSLSRLAGGDRLSSDTPAGAGTEPISNGINKAWPLGAGLAFNRTFVLQSGDWPNPIIFRHSDGTNSNGNYTATVTNQFASVGSSRAVCNLYWDVDLNPFNGNSRLMTKTNVSPMSPSQLRRTELAVEVPNEFPPGVYRPYVEMVASGKRRYLYRHAPIVVGFVDPNPRLSRPAALAGGLQLGVESSVGAVFTLDFSESLENWTPLGDVLQDERTNQFVVTPEGMQKGFYRVRLSTNFTRFNRHHQSP